MIKRCEWAQKNAEEQHYHDQEWGKPVYDDQRLFEMLILETMQAGLSWSTILKKRSSLKKAFNDWEYQAIAQYDQEKITELLTDPGIIRNQLKIKATITNARAFQAVQSECTSFSNYLWAFVDHQPILNHWTTFHEVPTTTELSDRISRDLKKRGFKFVGSTTIYAFMQSVGIVNDHLVDCSFR